LNKQNILYFVKFSSYIFLHEVFFPDMKTLSSTQMEKRRFLEWFS